jgi:hypothetical protein
MRTIRTPEKRRILLEGVASGLSVTSAARRAGIRSRNAIYQWKKADPTFADELEGAYEHGTDTLVDVALRRALMPDPRHDALLMFLLRSRDPRRFNPKQVDVRITGDPNRPVTVSHDGHSDSTYGGVRLIITPRDEDQDLGQDQAA